MDDRSGVCRTVNPLAIDRVLIPHRYSHFSPFDLAGGEDTIESMVYSNGDLFVAATTTTEDGDTDYLVIGVLLESSAFSWCLCASSLS